MSVPAILVERGALAKQRADGKGEAVREPIPSVSATRRFFSGI
jgi:hypothetical protein